MLAGDLVVPELLQLDCRAEQLVKYTEDLLNVPALRAQITARLLPLRSSWVKEIMQSTWPKKFLARYKPHTNRIKLKN